METQLTPKESKAVKLFSQKIKELLQDNLVEIKIFGSKVRGDYEEDSDIDILLVVNNMNYMLRENIYDILLEIDLEYDPKISLKIFTTEEMEINKQMGSPFIFNVEREGINL